MALVGLLDTNIISAIMRDRQGVLRTHARAAGPDSYCTSIVVAAELRFGAARVGSERMTREIEAVLAEIAVMPFEAPADQKYAELRAELERNGQPIGPNDLFIAAHALALDLTLVTANVGEFSRVRGLHIENWLR